MILDKVQLTKFRNFESVQFSPSPSLSIITGRNGSGKSSLLEALHDVKHSEHGVIINPITLDRNETIEKAKQLMKAHRVNGIPIVRGKKLVGIISRKDLIKYISEPVETESATPA